MQWNKVHLSLYSICKLHRPTPVTRQHRFSMYSEELLGSGGGEVVVGGLGFACRKTFNLLAHEYVCDSNRLHWEKHMLGCVGPLH